MTYSEPQTPLFPPSYVNLVNAKDHWKIGESEHNTDCDVTVGITNMYTPNICINPPMFLASRTCTAESSEVLQVLWRNKWGQLQKWQIMERNVMFQAVQGMWCAGMGWCLYSERQITLSNKIMRATKGTWLAVTLQRDDWGWWRMIYRSWAPLTSIWSCKMCSKYCCCSLHRVHAIANLESESKKWSWIRKQFQCPAN